MACCLADASAAGQPAIPREVQMVNAVLVSVSLEILQAIRDEGISERNGLWQHSYLPRSAARQLRRHNPNNSDEDEEERERNLEEARHFGLGFKDSVAKLGTVWIHPGQMVWTGPLPKFTQDFMLRFGFISNKLKRSLLRTRSALDTIHKADRVELLFRSKLQTDTIDAMEAIAQLCVRQYILELYDTLADRWRQWLRKLPAGATAGRQHGDDDNNTAHSGNNTTSTPLLHRHHHRRVLTLDAARAELLCALDPLERQGLKGLDLQVLRKIIPYPRIAKFRGPRGKQATHTSDIYLYGGRTGWTDKIMPLFAIEDDSGSAPQWDDKPYRRFIRRYYEIIRQERGDDGTQVFLRLIADAVSRHLWAVHQFEPRKWSVLLKASVGHSATTQAHIRDENPLERTGFYVPYVMGTAGGALAEWQRAERRGRPRPTNSRFIADNIDLLRARAQRKIRRLDPWEMAVFSANDGKPEVCIKIPRSLSDLGHCPMRDAIAFLREAGVQVDGIDEEGVPT